MIFDEHVEKKIKKVGNKVIDLFEAELDSPEEMIFCLTSLLATLKLSVTEVAKASGVPEEIIKLSSKGKDRKDNA